MSEIKLCDMFGMSDMDLMMDFHCRPTTNRIERLEINPATGETRITDSFGNVFDGIIENPKWENLR